MKNTNSNRSGRVAIGLSLALATVLVAATAFMAGRSMAAGENKGQVAAYVWADQASAKSYTPSAPYSFSLGKGSATITRSDAGKYQVKLPGVGSMGGHVQVTAYGAGTERCKVQSWSASGADQMINVLCFNDKNAGADTQFALMFVH